LFPPELGAVVAVEAAADEAAAEEAAAEELELALELELDAAADDELALAAEPDVEDEAAAVLLAAAEVALPAALLEAPPSHNPTQVAPATMKPGVKL